MDLTEISGTVAFWCQADSDETNLSTREDSKMRKHTNYVYWLVWYRLDVLINEQKYKGVLVY